MNRDDFPGPPFKRGRFDPEDASSMMTPEKVEYELSRVDDSVPPNKILCVHILNAVYPITCDIIHRVFSAHGSIARVVIFNKLTVNSMVEFEDVASATNAKNNLHGRSLYTGCCTLKIQYGKKERLEVFSNTPNSWDYTKAGNNSQGKYRDPYHGGSLYLQPPPGMENLSHAMSPDKVAMELGLKFKHPQNKILMFSFLNAVHPVNAKLVLSFCRSFGDVNKIIVFERLTPQAMVEFFDEESSAKAEKELHGRCIYPGANTIKVEFARKDRIDVERNSLMTWCSTAEDNDPTAGAEWSPEGRAVLIPDLPLKQMIKERYMSPEAVEGEFGLWVRQHNGPSKIVLISVMNAIYPITCEVLHKISSPVAKVVRIVIFERLSVQAMIEMETEEDAERLMNRLHGASIYPNACFMKAELCKKDRLKVKRNDDLTWDFTDPDMNTFPIPQSNSGRRRVLLTNPPVDQVDYEKRVAEVKVEFELSRPEKCSEPNKVLLVSVLNGIYPVDCDVAYRAFSQFGKVLRIAIFSRVTVQLMVEYASLEEAKVAKDGLNGSDLYVNCCTLKAEFCMKEKVDVRNNNRTQRWDFEKEPYVEGGMRGSPLIGGSGRGNPLIGGGSYPVSQALGMMPTPGGMNPMARNMMNQNYGMDMQYGPGRGDVMGRGGQYDEYGMGSNRGSQYEGMGRDEYGNFRGYGGNEFSGGTPCLMVYKLNPKIFNCDKLFNLLCLYGNIERIMFFQNNTENALVEFDDPRCVGLVKENLQNVEIFGKQVHFEQSKKMYKLNPKIFNCDKLFNLLCLYGNIERIMFFQNNTENALVEFDDPRCVGLVKENLQNVEIFGKQVHFEQSKKMYVDAVRNPVVLEDGTKGYKDFSDNRNNRFKRSRGPPQIYPVNSTILFFNTPRMGDDKLKEVFRSRDAPVPKRLKWFESRSAGGVGTGIMEFRSSEEAAEAVVLANHTMLQGPLGKDITMMLTFTKKRTPAEWDL